MQKAITREFKASRFAIILETGFLVNKLLILIRLGFLKVVFSGPPRTYLISELILLYTIVKQPI